jgi:obg-like ATPase 1
VLDCTFTYISTRSYSKRNKMPPKKVVQEEKILLGRPGNNLKSGIVGRSTCRLSNPYLT